MAKATKALVPILLSLLLLAVGCARKPPTITSISPNSGPSGGGTEVKITGENFKEEKEGKEGSVVTIAGKPLKNVIVDPEGTTVTGVTPGGPPGSQQVIATNPKAKEPSAPATFTYEGLKVVSTMPADGAALPWEPRTTQASAKLSQDVQTGTASLSISGVMGDASYDSSTRTVTFTASNPLRTGQSYEVTVSGAKDMAGNAMGTYSFSFSIEEAEKLGWYTVKEGDTLPIIAARPDIYEDESEEAWKKILSANQDREWVSEDGKYGSDNMINYKDLTPGMTLYIPR